MRSIWLTIAGLLLTSTTHASDWDAASATVVVFNTDFPESESLAKFYADKRGITPNRLIGLKCSKDEAISRDAYNEQLRDALTKAFNKRGWWKPQSRICIMVLMHGVPSKIIRQHEKPPASQEDEASVDAELCTLGVPDMKLAGAWSNPYFNKSVRFNELKNADGVLLVGRLDAASPATVRRMIEDAVLVEKTGLYGRAVIDLALKKGAYEEGDEWLRRTVQTYRKQGIPVFVDRYEPVLSEDWPLPDTALYFGWYQGSISGALKPASFRFKLGAIACHLHSFSASIIRTTEKAWVGPLLEHGAAAVMGNVWEPYLSLTIHFDILNERLLQGWTLAEAAWCATPGLSWQNVVIGDPLYRPFAHTSMGEGADRDYSLYKALVRRHASDPDTTKLKQEVIKSAQSHDSGRLLELLALLSSNESKVSEAVDLLEHAKPLCKDPVDELRLTLYQVELLGRDHEKASNEKALTLLHKAAAEPSLQHLPGFQLVPTLIKGLGD